VVRVAVATVPVVAGDDVGVLLVENRGQRPRRLIDVRVHQRGRRRVLRPTGHSRIGVAEPDDPGNPQHPGRLPELLTPVLGDSPAVGQIRRRYAVVAVRGDHEDNPVALVRRTSHRTGSAAGLVVGMGVHKHDGRHQAIIT
jgi:hypothetical protein